MADENVIEHAQKLLDIIGKAFPDKNRGEQLSIMATAVGLRTGEVMFPHDPRNALVSLGYTMGAAAAFAQNRQTMREVKQCEGTA